MDFLFSTLHNTPIFYGKIHFGVLHQLCASFQKCDTPPGSIPFRMSNIDNKSLNEYDMLAVI